MKVKRRYRPTKNGSKLEYTTPNGMVLGTITTEWIEGFFRGTRPSRRNNSQ